MQISAGTPVAGSDIPSNQTFTFNTGQYGFVTLSTSDGTNIVNIDDSSEPSDQSNVVLSSDSLAGLTFPGPFQPSFLGPIYFGTGSISMLNITGGSGKNTYTITGTPASQETVLNTGGGRDHVNVQGNSYPLTINSTLSVFGDVITLGDASNTLSGILADVTVNAGPNDALQLKDVGSARPRAFTVTGTTIAWGEPTVNYAGLGSVSIRGGTGGNTFNVLAASATAALNIAGGGNSDTLVGSNAGNTFAVTGSNVGTLSGGAYGMSVSFNHVGSLTAGSGGDTFQLADGASLTGNIVGGGTDTLDYRAYSTKVIVDLPTGLGTGVGGSISGIANVYGGSTTPAANGVFNLLIGKGGNTLTGGSGRRNILVAGGGGPSTLNGGDGEDLLIGGSTAYDTEAGLNTWQQIAAYWSGSDDYATRVANLTTGNGVPLLDATTVSSNGGGNTLLGGPGLNLYYGNATDNTDYDPNSGAVFILL